MDQKNFAGGRSALVKWNHRRLAAVADVAAIPGFFERVAVETFHGADIALQVIGFQLSAGAEQAVGAEGLGRQRVDLRLSLLHASIDRRKDRGIDLRSIPGFAGSDADFLETLADRDFA